MATVVNLADAGAPVDLSRCKPNRTGTATPQGSVTPAFSGEWYYDTTNAKSYRARGTTNADWEQFYPAYAR